jgi:ssDNA-binding replication factor A large subunit
MPIMANGSYGRLIEKISKSSGLRLEDIEQRIVLKREKISGMISPEGAAQIIAAELGISLDGDKAKIIDIGSGMRKVNTMGKVISLFPVRSFVRNGQESKVANIVIADDTSNIKAVLWDSNHIEMIESGKISEGSVVEIINASTRGNEIHLGSFSEIKPSSEAIENVKTEKVFREKPISNFEISDNVKTRAFVVQMFEPRLFSVCPECKKKAVDNGSQGHACEKHGKVTPEKRALMNLVIDDGTGTIRAVLFHETLGSLGIFPEEGLSEQKKKEILGKEMLFLGNVKMNRFFNNTELIIEEAAEVNLDQLLGRLENAR